MKSPIVQIFNMAEGEAKQSWALRVIQNVHAYFYSEDQTLVRLYLHPTAYFQFRRSNVVGYVLNPYAIIHKQAPKRTPVKTIIKSKSQEPEHGSVPKKLSDPLQNKLKEAQRLL